METLSKLKFLFMLCCLGSSQLVLGEGTNLESSASPSTSEIPSELNSNSGNEKKPVRETNNFNQRIMETSSGSRDFYQVLEDLLVEFEVDLQNKKVQGLENVSIRKIELSENLPMSFALHLEQMLNERILKRTSTKIINCIPCKSKKSFVEDDRLTITSNVSNIKELDKIAQSLEIDNFLDVTFFYNPGSMILSFSLFNIHDRALIWSKTYNSETVRATYIRKGIDAKAVEEARQTDVYKPRFKFYFGILEKFMPIGSSTPDGISGAFLKITERFDDNHQEFGVYFSYGQASKILFEKASAPNGSSDAQKALFKLYANTYSTGFIYQYNFIDVLESFNTTRSSIYLGAGPLIGTGYFTAEAQLGYQIFLGKTWFLLLGAQYSAPNVIRNTSGAQVSSSKVGGVGAHAVVGFVF